MLGVRRCAGWDEVLLLLAGWYSCGPKGLVQGI